MRSRFVVVSLLCLASGLLGSCKDGSPEAPDGRLPQCSDGVDNDGDGLIDFPQDPGCSSADDDTENSFAPPQCSDGMDNDGDGKTDYPDDPGCLAPQQDSETDDCPSGPNCPQCGNGIDDDGNGQIDYPADTGCDSASDDDEFTLNTLACGTTAPIQELPPTLTANSTLSVANGTATGLADTCNESATQTYPVAIYDLHLPFAKVVTVTTSGSAADTILDIRKTDCLAADAVIACNDDITMSNKSSSVTASLQAGHYLIVVVGKDITTPNFKLRVTLFAGQGSTCFMPTDCGPGLVCRVALGDTAMTCQPHACMDGVDDDGDGKNDYPDDPGCESPTDDDESDDCPSGIDCPQCGNGIDDDGDGAIDYPADSSCTSASAVSESCLTTEGVTPIPASGTITGDTTSATNDFEPTCAEDPGAADLMYSFVVPKLASLTIAVTSTQFWDQTVALLDASCGTDSVNVACDSGFEDTTVSASNVPAGGYFIDVDGEFDGEVGPFTLTISGTIAAGQSCESPLVTSGVLTCEGGLTCQGTAGSRTCFSLCSDGIDNDGDGKIDFPNDPGCDSAADNDETDTCPSGPTCPACGDGIDNDGDGLIDYPNDPNCLSAAGSSENFCNTDPDFGGAITAPVSSGNNAGGNQTFVSCGVSPSGNDETFSLTLPVALQTLNLDTVGSSEPDTVLEVHDSTCMTMLACNDDSVGLLSALQMTAVAAGTYAVTVESYQAAGGNFVINTAGVAVLGASCTSPLFAAGVLACDPSQHCTAGVCQ